jgi:hypothetical protein
VSHKGNREIVVLNIIWIVVIGFIAGIIAPGKDVARTGVKIGCQKGLRLKLASGVADQEPADRYGRHATAIPQCDAAGNLDDAVGSAIPETNAEALPTDFAIFEDGGELF